MENNLPKRQQKLTPSFENFGAFQFARVKDPLPTLQTKNWSSTLSNTFHRSWANSLEPLKGTTKPRFTLRMNDKVLTYSTNASPIANFQQTLCHTAETQALRTKATAATPATLIAEAVLSDMIRVIYGSNAIESAGLNLDETTHLCAAIFRGDNVAMAPKHADRHIVRTRNEVIQHARAFQHITNAVVIEQNAISEELLKATHAILSSYHFDVAVLALREKISLQANRRSSPTKIRWQGLSDMRLYL